MVVGLERLDEVTRDICGLLAEAAVEADLPATGLGFRECNINAKVPEHFDGRLSYFWKELVYEAGRAEGHPDTGGLPALSAATTSMPCHPRNVADHGVRHNRRGQQKPLPVQGGVLVLWHFGPATGLAEPPM